MRWLSFFSRPAWESRDPATRAHAVAGAESPELIAKLPDLARLDESAEVRRAAVQRVDDLSLLADRSRLDTDSGVRAVARARLEKFLCDGVAERLAQRERQLRVLEDSALIEAVAIQARDAATRRAALERIDRAGLIGERCLADPDGAIRLWLLGRIDNVKTLARIAGDARKSDKRLAQAARERLEATQLATGDGAAVSARLTALCAELEALLPQATTAEATTKLDALDAEWAKLRAKVDSAPDKRFEGLVATLRSMQRAAAEPAVAAVEPDHPELASSSDLPADGAAGTAAEVEAEAPAVASAETRTAEPEVDPHAPVDPELPTLIATLREHAATYDAHGLDRAKKAWARVWNSRPRSSHADIDAHAEHAALVAGIESRFETERATHAEALRRVRDSLAAMEIALREGHLHAARPARETVRSELAQHPVRLDEHDRKRLSRIDHDIDKMARWQHWSNQQVRERICDEVEALIGSGLHPDAVLTKIKDAQVEWAKLDAAEGIGASSPPAGLTRKFRALCHKAMAPTKPYLEKRSALRDERRAKLESQLAEAKASIEDANAPLPQLFTLKRQLGEAMRGLGELDPASRNQLAPQLRELLTRAGAVIDERNAGAEEVKRKLLANLKRKLAQAAPDEALDLAKSSMAQWKTLPRAARKLEDQLWAEYRALVDPLYDAAKSKADAERAELRGRDDAIRAVLDELAQLAKADDAALAHAPTTLAQIGARWKELANAERDLERRYDRAVAAVHEAQARAGARKAGAAIGGLFSLIRALGDAELGTPAAAGTGDLFAAADAGPTEWADRIAALDLALDQRVALELRIGGIDPTVTDDERRERDEAILLLAVAVECSAGIESPESAVALRRQHQMQRLAARMSGQSTPDEVEDSRQHLLAWCAQPAGTRAVFDDAATRIEAALTRSLLRR